MIGVYLRCSSNPYRTSGVLSPSTVLPLTNFFSRFWNPGAEALDAFPQDWSAENSFLVPPVALIPSVLYHLQSCSGIGVLVFPWWPSSPFWPLLWVNFRPFIQGILTMPGNLALVQGRNTNSLLGSPQFRSTVAAIRLDFSHSS